MTENGTTSKPPESPQPAAVADTNGSLEIIPESKKEDSPDRMPLQRPVGPKPEPEAKTEQPANPRVAAACELPLQKRVESEADKKPAPPGKEKAKTSRPASRKGSNSCKNAAIPAKEKVKEKESLYQKALKEFKMTGSKRLVPKSAAQTPKQRSTEQSRMGAIPAEQRDLFYQMRDSLLNLQKKDAVTRQTVERMQKEGRQLEEERSRKEQALSKCQKTRSADGTAIAKQEELIAKLRIERQASIRIGFTDTAVAISI